MRKFANWLFRKRDARIARESIKEFTRWRPDDESTPLDVLLLGSVNGENPAAKLYYKSSISGSWYTIDHVRITDGLIKYWRPIFTD